MYNSLLAREYFFKLLSGHRFSKKITLLGTELNDYNHDMAAALNKENQKSASQANAVMIITAVLSIILFMVLGRLISRMIVHPICSIQVLLGQAEKGDLTAAGTYTYTSRDELGRLTCSFNEMTSGLRDVIRFGSSASPSIRYDGNE